MVGCEGHQKAAGRLRIEKEVLIFWRNTRGKYRAFADKSSIVFEAAGKMTFSGGFNGAWKIRKGSVVDFEGDRRQPMSWIAERHFACMAQQAETRYVRD